MVAEVSLMRLPSDECHKTLLMSKLIQVMTWCRQATSHYLGQCWPRSMSPKGVTRPQWVYSRSTCDNSWVDWKRNGNTRHNVSKNDLHLMIFLNFCFSAITKEFNIPILRVFVQKCFFLNCFSHTLVPFILFILTYFWLGWYGSIMHYYRESKWRSFSVYIVNWCKVVVSNDKSI